MLAYVFWHWPTAEAKTYRQLLIHFHQALNTHPPDGLHYSRVLLLKQAPWLGRNEETYEDWYIIENSAALDELDQAAITGPRQQPHQQVARWAAGGTGGLYRLHSGDTHLPSVHFSFWFSKPVDMDYGALHKILQPLVNQATASLWVRQMTMGPASEFCIHSSKEEALPDSLHPQRIPIEQIWLSK